MEKQRVVGKNLRNENMITLNERVAISHVFICANDLLDRPLDVQYVKKNI